MKTKQRIKLTVVILTMIFVTVLGAGSHIAFSADKTTASQPSRKPSTALAQVNQPKLSASGIATWKNISNAKNYKVQLYLNTAAQGTPKTVASGKTGYNFLSIMRAAGPGEYTVKVTAKGDGKLYKDGPKSKSSTVQVVKRLTQSVLPTWSGDMIYWTADDKVSSYKIKVYRNDKIIKTFSLLPSKQSIDLSSIITKYSSGILTVTIQAKGSGLYLNGPVSTLDRNLKSITLGEVKKLTFSSSGLVTWSNVPNAVNYHLQLFMNNSTVGKPQTVSNGDQGYNFLNTMRELGTGSYTVKVTAIGDDLEYCNGPQSNASNAQVISKATPVTTLILSDKGVATWTNTNATSYCLKLYKNGIAVDIQNATVSGYNYLAKIRENGAGSYAVTVIPKSDYGLIIDGDESITSAPQIFNILTQLPQPVWSSGTITWSTDVNATNYEVKLYKNGNLVDTETLPFGTNSFDFNKIISKNGTGDYTVTVQAKGSGLYLDGNVSIPSQSSIKIKTYAWIMFNSSDWILSNNVGNTYTPSSKSNGIFARDAEITGPGTYTVSLDFTGTASGFANSTAFSAIGIANGELLYPGYVINITDIKVNGVSIGLTGKPYTVSDDQICTRVNLYNQWVTSIPVNARSVDGNLSNISPMIIYPGALGYLRTLSITFEYGPGK